MPLYSTGLGCAPPQLGLHARRFCARLRTITKETAKACQHRHLNLLPHETAVRSVMFCTRAAYIQVIGELDLVICKRTLKPSLGEPSHTPQV